MKEKLLSTRKNGMGMLFVWILAYVAATVMIIFGAILLEADDGDILGVLLLIIGIIYCILGWIPFLGLKILKPQEALVLTLFGKYLGTLKGDGFYWVNPFCSAVNPAAATKLRQSGDVSGDRKSIFGASLKSGDESVNLSLGVDKRISLKMMTLNNDKQKINERLSRDLCPPGGEVGKTAER